VIFAYADRAGHLLSFSFHTASSKLALGSLKMVLVDHHAHAAPAFIFKAADHAAMAIDLNIARDPPYRPVAGS
jgi:hypothetical protein